MPFTQDAWKQIEPLYAQILQHPFLLELSAGTLSRERFQHYMLQDSLYLIEFARALSLIAAKAPDPALIFQFSVAAQQAIVVERALHEDFFKKFDLDPSAIHDTHPTPICLAYTNFLIATAHQQPVEIAIAGIIPCFWIYQEVGTHIHQQAAPDNDYQAWIDTYADDDFAEAVRSMKSITNRLAEMTDPGTRGEMMQAFIRASQYEWMFWDSAYQLAEWPV